MQAASLKRAGFIIKEMRDDWDYMYLVKDLIDLGIFRLTKKDFDILSDLGQYRLYFFISRLGRVSLPLSADERRLMRDLSKVINSIPRIAKTSKNSALYNILSPVSLDVVRLIPVLKPELEKKIKNFTRLARVKPFITGNDLKRLKIRPQKKYTSILKKVYNMQLDGQITARRQALQYIRSIK